MLVSKHHNIISVPEIYSLEEFMVNPPDGMEWVDNQLVEKTGMTLKHSEVQVETYVETLHATSLGETYQQRLLMCHILQNSHKVE
jgi:hypothetical protein